MSDNTKTRLDPGQVIKRVYDQDTESIRTLTEIAIADIVLEVHTDAGTDSIAIGNPDNGNTIDVQADGSINTNVSNLPDTVDTNYGIVGAGTVRTASQIGNASGIADFGNGATTIQTLRVSSNTMGLDPNGSYIENKESGIVTSNCTSTPLLAGATYTGTWVDASQYSCISFTVNSDVDSAASGLRLQFSADNGATIIRQSATNFTGSANGVFFSFPVHARYFRMFYQNGAVNQTRFLLDTQLHEEYNGLAAVPLDTPLNDKSTATTVKSIITAKSVDGIYTNQRASGVSTLNSTSTPLTSGATYTGTFEDVIGFAGIAVTVFADQDSATDGFVAEFSTNGVNVDHSDFFTITASQGNQVTFGVLARYFRIRYVNGAVAQSAFRLGTLYNLTDTKPSSIRIDDEISGENDAELIKAVLTGENPNGNFVNELVQGAETANSSYTPLDANATFRGIWRNWANDYLTLISSVSSDVSGTLYIDASDDLFPVDGSDASITYSTFSDFDPSLLAALRRNTPVQSLWVRHRYINGPAAQSTFSLNAIFTTNDPGSVYLPSNTVPHNESLAAVDRSIVTVRNAANDGFQDLPIDSLTGNPKTTISNLRDDILLKPLTSAMAAQVIVGTTAVRIDPFPVTDRRSTMITNDGLTSCAVGFSNAITFNSGSMRIPAGSLRVLPFSEDVQYWAIAENTGGVQSTLTRTGTTSGGTATGTANTLSSNNVYANITAAAQTATLTDFTAGTVNSLVSVKLGMEASKQASQFETVAISEVQSGSTTGAGTVSSASLAGGSAQLYVAFVSRNNNAGTITQVLGGGVTFTASLQNLTVGNRRLDVWYGYGTFSAGVVTASLATSTNAHITVYRIANADSVTPIQTVASNTGTGTAVTGPAIAGTNKGYSLLAISHTAASGTAGAGYTENADATNGSGGNIDSLSTESKALVVTGAETGTYTLGSSSVWGAIGVTITPKAAITPTVTLSYQLSAVTGVTSGLATISSTSDANFTVDVTGDRSWVVADIPNIKIIATGTTISAAAANIDQLYLELVDTTGNTTRLSVVQGGEALV